MRIAIIGTGISGLAASWLLDRQHDVHVYEAAARVGGHTHTVLLDRDDAPALPVDTGFIVYNEPTYPMLTRLFDELDVADAHYNLAAPVPRQARPCACGHTTSGSPRPAPTLPPPTWKDRYRQHRPMIERSIAWLVRRGHRRVRFRGIDRNRLWLGHRAAAVNLQRLLALGLTHNGTWALAPA